MKNGAGSEDWPARVRRLEEEVAGLRRAMRTRGLIEQAKGMLAERLGCDPESAFSLLSARSQETNVPLVRIAADLVGAMPTDLPQPPEPQPPDESAAMDLTHPSAETGHRLQLHTITELDRRTKPPALSATANRDLRLAIAALDAATDTDELVRALVTVGLKDQPDAAAALFFAQPDGALRMLSCHGWPAQAMGEWRRLPSSINTAVGHAVRTAAPVLLDGHAPHEFVLVGPPSDVRLVFPLSIGGRVVGAWQFAWPKATRRIGAATKWYLSHLAVAAGRALGRLLPAGIAELGVTDLDWVRAVLDAMHGQAHLLVPLRNPDGEVIDFTIEAVSADAAESDKSVVGRRLLDAYPHLSDNGVFAGYIEALTHGRVWQRRSSHEETIVHDRKRRILVSRRASRVGGAVLASWDRLDETISRDRHLARLEAFGGFGWAEWDLNTGDARWSAGMCRLLGKDPTRDPPAFAALTDLVDSADQPRMERFVAEATSGRDSVVDVRVKSGEEVRWLRLFCEAQSAGVPQKNIQLLAQDVTDRYAKEQHLRSMQSRAAAGRLRLASQQDLTARLAHVLYPQETVSLSTDAVTVSGRHYFGDSDNLLHADFFDAVELPDGNILMLVGDMFGAGVMAAATAVRVIRPVIAMGIAGTPLTRILEVLNTDLRRDEDPALASLLLANFDPLTGELSFSSAGHLPAIWLRHDLTQPRLLSGGIGPVLGLIEKPEYQLDKTALTSGDAIVLYTDGVIDHHQVNPLQALQNQLEQRYRDGGIRALLEVPPDKIVDEACIAVLEVQGLKQPQSG